MLSTINKDIDRLVLFLLHTVIMQQTKDHPAKLPVCCRLKDLLCLLAENFLLMPAVAIVIPSLRSKRPVTRGWF